MVTLMKDNVRNYTLVYKEGMDQWLLAVTSDPAAKESAKDLEVAVLVWFTAIFPFPLFPYHV